MPQPGAVLPTISASTALRRRSTSWQAPAVLAGAGTVIVAAVLAMNRDGGQTGTAAAPREESTAVRKKTVQPPQPDTEMRSPSGQKKTPVVSPTVPATNDRPPPKPDTTKTEDAGSAKTNQTDQTQPDSESNKKPTESLPTEDDEKTPPKEGVLDPKKMENPPAAKRLPVPEKASQTEKETEIRATFADDFGKKKTADVWNLAQKLGRLAAETSDDATARYVLLKLARDLSVQIGDSATARKSAEDLARVYEVDAVDAVGTAILSASKANSIPPTARAQLATDLEHGLNLAFQADRYPLAKDLNTALGSVARSLKDSALLARTTEMSEAIGVAEKQLPEILPVLEKLKTSPDDADANLAVGRFECFIKGAWESGLARLAKGSDETLSTLAQDELKRDVEPAAIAGIADRWHEQSLAASSVQKRQIQAHALHAYVRALPGTSGLTRTRAGARIRDIQEATKIWIDLLPTIELPRDAASGTWLRRGEKELEGSHQFIDAIINTAIEPAGSYEFKAEFTRLSGNNDIFYFIPVGPTSCTIELGGNGGGASWIDRVDNQRGGGKNPTLVKPSGIHTGQRYVVHATIRVRGSTANILVKINGRDYMGFRGDLRRLTHSDYAKASDPKRFGFGAWAGTVAFHSLQFLHLKD
jgi:hypothetical protein